MISEADKNPRHHTQQMQARLQEAMDHLREDIEKVDEPQLQAMFETVAEVLGGLKKAFRHRGAFAQGSWAKSRAPSMTPPNAFSIICLNTHRRSRSQVNWHEVLLL